MVPIIVNGYKAMFRATYQVVSKYRNGVIPQTLERALIIALTKAGQHGGLLDFLHC
jgi:hypothetical protein